MAKRSWYASGKERKPGNLLKYALFTLVGVLFAAGAVWTYLYGYGVGYVILGGVIFAAIAAVVGLIIWFVYMKLIVKQ